MLLVEVNEIRDNLSIFVLDWLLAPHLKDHDSAPVLKLDLLTVALVVLTEGIADCRLLELVFPANLLEVLEDKHVLADGRILDEVLEHALLMLIAHLYKFSRVNKYNRSTSFAHIPICPAQPYLV